MESKDWQYNRMLDEGLIIKYNEPKIIYVSSDGKKFEDLYYYERHEKIVSRQMYYEYLLSKRNWFMRFFNIKPSMDFYDKMTINLK
mgnify:FL=1